MKRRDGTVLIAADNIHQHPDNPRKDLGDLSELTASIKEHGILQNITVMPYACLSLDKDEQTAEGSEYVVLLGHRRLVAFRIAGGGEVPCNVIYEVSRAEQIGLMLEENAQRNDLTVPEQIESFQMLLDLGETVENISKKTGFSRSTIYKRVKNADVVDAIKESDYQFTISDLEELSKVPAERKAEVIERTTSAQTLRQEVDRVLHAIKRDHDIQEMKEALDKLGVLEWDEEAEKEHGYWYQQEIIKTFKIGEKVKLEPQGDEFYKLPEAWSSEISVRRPQSEETEEDSEETEIERKREEARAKIRNIEKNILGGITDFVRRMVKEYGAEHVDIDELMKLVGKTGVIRVWSVCRFADIPEDEFYQYFRAKHPNFALILIASLWDNIEHWGFITWDMRHDRGNADTIIAFMKIIEAEGYKMPEDEYLELLEGKSELYKEVKL